MTALLDTVTDAVRDRVDAAYRYNRAQGAPVDWLTAAYHVVEGLSVPECRILLSELCGKALARTDADIAQVAAARAGVAVGWQHAELRAEGLEWEVGRGEVGCGQAV